MTFPGIFGQMARQYFSRYGDHRATLARIGGQEPSQRRAQSLCAGSQGPGIRVLQHGVGQEPAGGRSAAQDRLLAGVRWRRSAGASGRKNRSQLRPRGLRFRSVHKSTTGCRCRAATRASSRPAPGLERRAENGRLPPSGPVAGRGARLLYDRRAAVLRGDGLADRGAGSRVLDDGSVSPEGRLPVNVSGGPESQGASRSAPREYRCTRCAAMQLTGQAGEMQVRDPRLAGRFQHGGGRGRQLRQHPGTVQIGRPLLRASRFGGLALLRASHFGRACPPKRAQRAKRGQSPALLHDCPSARR